VTETQPSDQHLQGDRLLDVVVVGAVRLAWHLAQRGLSFVVLEAGPEIGTAGRGS
jgi:flavin-dependent dehydrogenase